jgi:hypothetical protein
VVVVCNRSLFLLRWSLPWTGAVSLNATIACLFFYKWDRAEAFCPKKILSFLLVLLSYECVGDISFVNTKKISFPSVRGCKFH